MRDYYHLYKKYKLKYIGGSKKLKFLDCETDEMCQENGFDKYRLTLGTEYKFKKMGTLGLFYRFEKELNESIPETTKIIGIKYSYTIKNKKK